MSFGVCVFSFVSMMLEPVLACVLCSNGPTCKWLSVGACRFRHHGVEAVEQWQVGDSGEGGVATGETDLKGQKSDVVATDETDLQGKKMEVVATGETDLKGQKLEVVATGETDLHGVKWLARLIWKLVRQLRDVFC